MERRNNGKKISIVALFLAIIGLSVGFATLSTNLTINGTGKVKTSTWDVHFANLSPVTRTGTAVEITPPTLTATKVGDYSVDLSSPGDSIEYTFDIVNAGSYDAKISTITIPTPQCTGTGGNLETDASNVCNNLTYTLTYSSTGETVKNNDTLNSGETKNVRLILTFSGSAGASELPAGDVTISNLNIPITYVQI